MKNPPLAISASARRRWTQAPERARWAEAWERSDQTQSEFAQAHGLKVSTLRKWIRQRGGSIATRQAVGLEEISLGELIGPEIAARTTAWELEIRLPSGVAIALARGTTAARLRELVEAVRC